MVDTGVNYWAKNCKLRIHFSDFVARQLKLRKPMTAIKKKENILQKILILMHCLHIALTLPRNQLVCMTTFLGA